MERNLTFEEARALKYREVLVDIHNKRWYVNGKVQLWKSKKNAHRIRVPLKHGLYAYDAITEADFAIDGFCVYFAKENN